MRRGQRNKWTRDNAPHDGLDVTICEDGQRHNYTIEMLAIRRMNKSGVTNASIAKLRKYGWL